MFLLEVGWDALHDLVSLCLVINGMSVEVFGSPQFQLGDVVLVTLLDCDLFCLGKVLLLPPHDFDELLQIVNSLWLHTSRS